MQQQGSDKHQHPWAPLEDSAMQNSTPNFNLHIKDCSTLRIFHEKETKNNRQNLWGLRSQKDQTKNRVMPLLSACSANSMSDTLLRKQEGPAWTPHAYPEFTASAMSLSSFPLDSKDRALRTITSSVRAPPSGSHTLTGPTA